MLAYPNQAEVKQIIDGLKPMLNEVEGKLWNKWLTLSLLGLFGLILFGLIVVAMYLMRSKASPRSDIL